MVDAVTADLKFFHWEIEFPDVFTPQRSGFDAMIGNPPWDVMKPNSKEFFSDPDPVYRTYDKQDALRRQGELFEIVPGLAEVWDEYNARFKALGNWVKNAALPFDIPLARGKDGTVLGSTWAKKRQERAGFANPEHPFRHQGSADLNSYKLFLEFAYLALRQHGRMGFVVPSGIYSDSGSKDLRELFLEHSEWEWLFSFENKRKIFEIHSSFKFAATIVARQSSAMHKGKSHLLAAFMVHDLSTWERADPPVFHFDRGLIPLFSPRSKSLPEVRTEHDLKVCERIYARSFRIGDNAPGWEITYATEFHMTNDSKSFKPRECWERIGYAADVYGRWIGPDGDVALPLYEGRMVGLFDCSEKAWVSGRGRSAVWREIPFDGKTIEPQFLIAQTAFDSWDKRVRGLKLGYMSIGSATNSRTGISSVIGDVPCGNSVSVLLVDNGQFEKTLATCGAISSLSYDYALRARLGGINLNWFILEETALPEIQRLASANRLISNTAYLSFLHRRFAHEWLKLKHLYPELATKEWKHWWAVTEAERLRLRVEIDALCADLYGLDPDDFDWIVRDDPSDAKGFYRVDRQLHFRERLTGLAAAGFRALKEGKWSAESAASLSNDEFFEILGIPELTSAQAAHARGLPGPLIEKRDGCHVWRPESFPADDPRHGWTWDDCWNDAVALLGSEEAVRQYVEGEAKPAAPSDDGESFRLESKQARPSQRKLF
jgi:hypothetical protein